MENNNNNNKNIKNKTVETYAGDMTKAIDGNEGSYIRKVIAEQEQLEDEKQNQFLKNKKNKILISFSILLIICALGSLAFLFFFKENIFTVPVNPQFTPIIYLDDTTFKEISGLTKDQIAQSISNEVSSTEIKLSGVLGIYLTLDKKIVGLRSFFKLISANIDQNQISFINDNFLIGVTNIGNKNLFMLIKIRSIADVFDTIRSWENKMFNDLHGFFGVNITSDTKYLLTKNFEDSIIQNKNARILRDNNGNIVIMYVFIDDTSLIITNNEVSVREVMLRLSSSIIRK
jgi:hypothetical protein